MTNLWMTNWQIPYIQRFYFRKSSSQPVYKSISKRLPKLLVKL